MGTGVRGRVFPISFGLFALVGTGALVQAGGLTGVRFAVVGLVSALFAQIVSEASARASMAVLRPLTDAAKRIHEGEASVRALGSNEEAESRELGQALDKLAASLTTTLKELRAERDLVSGVLEGMQEGVMLLDASGNVALMNPAFREMLLVRGDMVGMPLLEVVRHAELKELFDKARKVKSATSGEVEVGGLKPRRLLVRASAFAGGGVLGVFFDVTEIRRLESLRRDFVANVSHELRTPVTAVLSAAETVRLVIEKDPKAADRFLSIIERNAERLQRLIEDLLDLSRIESRELKLAPELFATRPFAQHVVGLFRERAEKKRITLVVDMDDESSVFADRRALEQVVTNLVDNAVKYCPEGAKVTLRAHVDGHLCRLTIADTGPGVEASHLPRLFERFYRVDPGRSRDVGGTGLGLAIVKHLSEAMGGAVKVESELGRGTSFTVSLPARKVTPKEQPSARVLA